MGSALKLNQATETKWTITSGAMKGAVRLMSSTMFTIGRSPECEFVVVNDPKCSRKHATVQWTDADCEITSLNPQNLVLINGKEVESGRLSDGDRVGLGDTEVQFNLTTTPLGAGPRGGSLALAPKMAPPPQMYPHAPSPAMAQPPRPRTPPPQQSQKGRVIFYGIIALVGGFFLLPSAKKKAEMEIRSEKQVQADLNDVVKLQEAAVNTPNRRFDTSVPARQAQENFVRGFRDFRKGQYERSLDSFQACLALDPTHPLCTRYNRMAQRKFDEIVAENLVLGTKYRVQNQFQACRAAFRNVMVMVKDANNIKYKEAKMYYDYCNLMTEGRY